MVHIIESMLIRALLCCLYPINHTRLNLAMGMVVRIQVAARQAQPATISSDEALSQLDKIRLLSVC